MAKDYIDTIALIEASDKLRQTDKLKVQISNSSLGFYQEDTVHQESEMQWYRFDITQLVKQSKDGQVYIEVKEFHRRRRTPFPANIELKVEQTLEFIDSRFLLSPYAVTE